MWGDLDVVLRSCAMWRWGGESIIQPQDVGRWGTVQGKMVDWALIVGSSVVTHG